MSEPTPPQTVEEYKAAQEAEWGQYVATAAIDIDGARAFNAGNPVPVSHVKSGAVKKDQVTDLKAAESSKSKTETKG